MDWDQGGVFASDQQLRPGHEVDEFGDKEISPVTARKKFREFLRNFHRGSVFVYREQLLHNVKRGKHFLEITLEDLSNFEMGLQDLLKERPATFLPQFELAAKDLVKALRPSVDNDSNFQSPDIQITLKSDQVPMPLRSVNATHVNTLVKVPGIIISATKTRPKALTLHLKCRGCGQSKTVECGGSFTNVSLPRQCSRERLPGEQNCPIDPYVICPDKCTYVDQQTLKLQEAPEVVPTGEMPRHVLLSVDRSLANRLAPGVRVCVLGISSIFQSKASSKLSSLSIRTPFIRVVGLQRERAGAGEAVTWTPQEEERFLAMSREPGIFDKICRSISPAISGDYTVDIKKAVAALLFGGSRKLLPDGMKLRGDINVLLLGDPSTAKSQFLKFVEKVAPVSVYTSGKGSSAAGLTASVIKDSRGDFYLEGGAMVLADGGVVCIDEFDKMREQDRVAIHEAMEQQTISIAKAGITTILNSRVSVLAAANPVYGRYDDDRTAAENIDFLPTILSRFDLIFIVRDIQDEKRDMMIARHVMGVHINAGSQSRGKVEGEIDLETMTKYISYCRQKCAPRLSSEASEMLRNHYVHIRASARQRNLEEASSIPITVRQLEAIVRISESLAKMTLSNEATVEHVTEAIRLFKVSTLHAANSGSLTGETSVRDGVLKEVQAVEDQLKRRVAIGSNISVKRVVDEFQRQGHSEYSIRKAIHVMVSRGDMTHRMQRKQLRRMR